MSKQLIFALLLAGVLAGCTEKPQTVDGKDVNYWAQEARRLQNTAPKAQPQPSAAEALKAQQEAEKNKAEFDTRLRQEATLHYVARAQEQIINIRESKDGKILLDAVAPALNREISGGADVVLLGSMFDAHDAAMKELLPKKGDTVDDARMVSEEAVFVTERSMRAEIFAWLASDPKQLDAIWTVVRPMLRLQYGLLATLRGHEALFKTKYTSGTFEPLRECLIWDEELKYELQEGALAPHPEAKRCNIIFKQFGVKAQFGVVGGKLEKYATRNALYIVRFLARRGEQFAQQIQLKALDYIKQ